MRDDPGTAVSIAGVVSPGLRMTKTLRAGIDRAAKRDRRVPTDWILRVLEDAVAESDAKAIKSDAKAAKGGK